MCKSRGTGDGGAVDTRAHLPTDVMASAGNTAPLGLKGPANIRPHCTATRDLTNHLPHSAILAMPLSSIYTEAANRNHPLYEGRLVSGHWPFMVMDVNEA